MKSKINLKLICVMMLMALTTVVRAQDLQSGSSSPDNTAKLQIQMPSNDLGSAYLVIDSSNHGSCYNNANLSVTNTVDSAGNCVFMATATVSTSNYVVGYQWTEGGTTVIHHVHTTTDHYTFTVSPGSSGTVSVIIYLANLSFTDSSGTCCQVNLSGKVKCDSVAKSGCCLDTTNTNLTYSGGELFKRCSFTVFAHAALDSPGCHLVGYIWHTPSYTSGLVGWSSYIVPIIPTGSSTTVSVTFITTNGYGDTCKFTRSLTLSCPLIKRLDSVIIIRHGLREGNDETGFSNDNAPESGVNVFPNPADNEVTIVSESEKITSIQLIDIYGKKLADYTYEGSGSVNVPLKDYPAGTYLLRINNSISRIITKR